jgi:hypothetical protein
MPTPARGEARKGNADSECRDLQVACFELNDSGGTSATPPETCAWTIPRPRGAVDNRWRTRSSLFYARGQHPVARQQFRVELHRQGLLRLRSGRVEREQLMRERARYSLSPSKRSRTSVARARAIFPSVLTVGDDLPARISDILPRPTPLKSASRLTLRPCPAISALMRFESLR